MAALADVVLTVEEREVLERWARRPTSAQALAFRCRIVLAPAEGRASKQIAAELGCNHNTVSKRRGRFARRGFHGLHDEPRPGKPRTGRHQKLEQVDVTGKLDGGVDMGGGRVLAELTPRQRAVEFRRFLNRIDASVPADLEVHVVLDNSSTHKTPSIQRWLLRHPRFTFHFTPTYSSWLNLVERWFAELTTKSLKRGAHRSLRHLVASIHTWLAN